MLTMQRNKRKQRVYFRKREKKAASFNAKGTRFIAFIDLTGVILTQMRKKTDPQNYCTIYKTL